MLLLTSAFDDLFFYYDKQVLSFHTDNFCSDVSDTY